MNIAVAREFLFEYISNGGAPVAFCDYYSDTEQVGTDADPFYCCNDDAICRDNKLLKSAPCPGEVCNVQVKLTEIWNGCVYGGDCTCASASCSEVSTSNTVFFDNKPPQGVSLSHITYSTTTTIQINLNQGTDPDTGISSAILYRREAILESNSCETFGDYTQLADNPSSPYSDNIQNNKCYEYKYEVKDGQNNIATIISAEPLKVDTEPPSFTVYSPINNTLYSTDVVINASSASDNQGIAEYKYSLNDGSYQNLVGYPTILLDGNYKLVIYAKDYVGLTKTEVLYFKIDKTYPEITINSPIENMFYDTNSVSLDYSINEETAWVKYAVDNRTNVTISGSTTITDLAEGEHNLTLYVMDTAGWVSEKKIKFYTDTIYPELGIYVPQDGGVYGSSLVIGYMTNEKLKKAEYQLDSGAKVPLGIHQKIDGLTQGPHTLTVYIEDFSGHKISKSVSFSVDLALGYLLITSPITGHYNTDYVTLTYDTNKDLSQLGYSLDNDVLKSAYQNQIIENIEEGQHTLALKGIDLLGNEISDNVTFTIDLTKPVLDVSSPINKTYSTHTIPLQYTASDGNLDKVVYSIDGGSEVTLYGNTNLNLVDGDYSLLVKAVDKAGNSVEQMIEFSVDTVRPVVEILSPQQTVYLNNTIEIEFTVSKPYDSVRYILNGFEVGNLENLGDGAYNLIIEVTSGGNVGRASVAFVVVSADIILPEQTEYYTNIIDFIYNSSENLDKRSYILDDKREKLLKEKDGSRTLDLDSGWHNLTLYAYYQGIVNSRLVKFRTGIKDLSISNGDISMTKISDNMTTVNITIWNIGDYDVDKVEIKYLRGRNGLIEHDSIRIINLSDVFAGTSQSFAIVDDQAQLNDIMHIFIDPDEKLIGEQRHNNYAKKLYNFRPEIEGVVPEFMGEAAADTPLYNPIYVLPTDVDDNISRVEFILPNGLRFVDSDGSDGWTFDLDMSWLDKYKNYIDIIAYDWQGQPSAVVRQLFKIKDAGMINLPPEMEGLWKDLFELYTLIQKIIDLISATQGQSSSMGIQEAGISAQSINLKELIEKPNDISCYDGLEWINCEFLGFGKKLEKVKATCENSNYVRFKLDKGDKTLFDDRIFENGNNVYVYDNVDIELREQGEYQLAVS